MCQQVLSLCKLNLDDDDARAIAQGLSSSVSRNQAGAGAGGWTLKQAQQKPKHHKRGRGTTATASNTNGDAQDNSNKNNSCKMHPTGQLRRLLLSENAIGDEGCAAIVAALRDRDQATLDALRVRQSKTSASSSGNGQNTQDLKIPFGSPQKVEEDKDGDGKESNKEDDEWLPEGLWELDLSHNRITETGAAQLLTYLKSANNRHHHTRALATSSTSSASRREAWPSGQNKDNMSNHHENNISNSNVSDSVDHLLDSFLGPLGPPTSCTGSSLVRLELKGNLVNDSVARAASHLMRDFPYLEVSYGLNLVIAYSLHSSLFTVIQNIESSSFLFPIFRVFACTAQLRVQPKWCARMCLFFATLIISFFLMHSWTYGRATCFERNR